MFTGIVEETGKIIRMIRKKDRQTLTIFNRSITPELKIGDSVSVNGVCLTVTNRVMNEFDVEMVPETLSRTTLGAINVGTFVNLERAMKSDGRFDGHIVTGHVDSKSTVIDIQTGSGGLLYEVVTPDQFSKYIIEKGSICVDGVSLTIAKVNKRSFNVAVIPLTLANTNLRMKKAGDLVNLEFDILGKYVDRLLGARYVKEWPTLSSKKIDMEFLKQAGF